MGQRICLTIGCWISLVPIDSAMAQFRPDRPTFFEEGDRQFQREVDRLNRQPQGVQPILTVEDTRSGERLIALSDDVAIATAQLDWQRQENDVFRIPLGDIELQMIATEQDSPSVRFAVAYSEPLTSAQIREPEVLFQQMQAVFQANAAVEQVSTQPLTFESNPGWAISFIEDNRRLECRMYLINQRLYILAADQLGMEAQARQMTDEFLNSLRLLSLKQ
ncbi:MAG: hypothetical protein HC835_12480 [Oscillatoriales cyanobacterium RM2_1_1]|nr:hypothetical protein [Oscillatoriales cyanobacterium SM2_3_0]NJO46371.1 hypothetical protein [Oscillatoriales cyanobacterium RM2_1_1]